MTLTHLRLFADMICAPLRLLSSSISAAVHQILRSAEGQSTLIDVKAKVLVTHIREVEPGDCLGQRLVSKYIKSVVNKLQIPFHFVCQLCRIINVSSLNLYSF